MASWRLVHFFFCTVFSSGLCASAQALSLDEACYLLGRTGFGASPEEIKALLPLNRAAAVDSLLAGLRAQPFLPQPRLMALPRPNYVELNSQSSKNSRPDNEAAQLQQWWIDEMITTPSPMTERLVLFWHNHFVSRILTDTVSAPMLDQLQWYRQNATGNLRVLLRGVVRDPMMLTFLNNIDNKRAHPNENLARELMELFTLGTGHYSEHDVKELARVLTGHGVDRNGGWHYRYEAVDHDDGPVDFLGHRGKLDIDAAIDVILDQPAAAEFIVRKLWREFVSLEADEANIQLFAQQLRDSDYEIRPVLRRMLLSDAFWSPQQRGGLAKSPVDLVVGFVRSFGLTSSDISFLSSYIAKLGQSLMDPPTVAGWPGGVQWLTSASLPRQKQIIERLWAAYTVGKKMAVEPFDSGLRVRLSNEYLGEQAQVRVLVNNKPLGEYRLSYGLDRSRESDSSDVGYIKPAWEEIYIPAQNLPAKIRSVAVQTMDDSSSAVFVNWMQLGGDRYPAYRARRMDTTASCNSPTGMMYCKEVLSFDVPALHEVYRRPEALQEDTNAESNETIEVSTVRELGKTHPAARTDRQLQLSFEAELHDLAHTFARQKPEKEVRESLQSIVQSFVLPIEPMQPERFAAFAKATPLLQAKTLTMDPAYLLK